MGKVPMMRREVLVAKAMQWLLTKHEGIELYAGIVDRDYTDEEKDTIAQDTGAVSGLPCPFLNKDGSCGVIEGGPQFNRIDETGKAPYGFLPALVVGEWARQDYKAFARRGLIADAKVCLLERNEGFVYRTRTGILVG